MRFRLIDAAKKEFPVQRLCKVLGVMRIPTQSGQGFRFDVGHRSDLIPATIPK
jgi:hypothetical protein